MTIGPAVVQRRTRSYATPGMSCVGRADAAGASTSETSTAKKSLRLMRPRFTVAEATAILVAVAFLCTAGAGSAASVGRDRPVPSRKFHVIAEAPAGSAYPNLFVSPSD